MGSAEQSPFLLTMFVALALISWFCHPGQADIVYDLAQQSGPVYLPGQSGFEEKRKVMNAACTAQPAVIVVPNFDQDVSTIIKATKANNLELSVRSGGHSYTCTNIKEGGVHMDMRSFNKLEMVDTALSPTGKALNLGPGRLWGDVLEFAPPEKYSYPHGQCRSVGVGGYLLGGGVNWLGTYNKYGYGAEHVLKMKVVLADGSVAWVDKDKTDIFFPAASIRTISHTESNNLFFALRGAGSSFGVVTEFLYMINQTPEADPAVLLCWVESEADLTAIHNAAKATNDYSITVSQEFANEFWKKELTQVVYELYPGIMEGLKRLNFKSGYPVPLTVTDIRTSSGHKTDAAKASDYMKSQGVRMVFEFDLTTSVFHNFAEYLYGNNMVEQQNWEPGKYFLTSLNFGGLQDTSSFQDIFFNDPSFGVKRSNFLEFASHDCDYCFWMIHYRNRQRQTSISQSAPISSTLTSSACSLRPMLTVPTSSSVSRPRLKVTLLARVTANMPISPAVQNLTGPLVTGVTTHNFWISNPPGTQPTSSTIARVLAPPTSPAVPNMSRLITEVIKPKLAWEWGVLELGNLASFLFFTLAPVTTPALWEGWAVPGVQQVWVSLGL